MRRYPGTVRGAWNQGQVPRRRVFLTTGGVRLTVRCMTTPASPIEPPRAVLDAALTWLAPVRAALGTEFFAAYFTGSVLAEGFDPRRSRVNLLVVARELPGSLLDPLSASIDRDSKALVRFEPLFVTRRQIDASLDVFPIEWLDLQESHLLVQGEDFLSTLEVPRANLRLQCEHELRGKHLRLRQEYLAAAQHPERLRAALMNLASGFHTLFRTLLRLRGETPPSSAESVIERVAELYALDARGLLGAHVVRHADPAPSIKEAGAIYLRFLGEIEALVAAIDGLLIP
ncbi:MAG: hypothetical protein ABIU54_09125 [Candidatus Eisenbacteria bacterium]